MEDLMSYLKNFSKQENSLYGEAMHNPKVVFNEDILVTGAAIYAYSAINWLKNN